MAIVESGKLRLRANIGAEVDLGAASNVKLNSTEAIRKIIDKAAGVTTRMSEFYGQSAGDDMIIKPISQPSVSGWWLAKEGWTADRGANPPQFTVPAGYTFYCTSFGIKSQNGYMKSLSLDGVDMPIGYQPNTWPWSPYTYGRVEHNQSFIFEIKSRINVTLNASTTEIAIHGYFQQN